MLQDSIDLTGKFRSPKKPPLHWMDLEPDERLTVMSTLGLPKFRAKQISTQLFQRLNPDVDSWTDLPATLRTRLADELFPPLLEVIFEQKADRGTTIKIAWKAFDGVVIESVIMLYPDRATICISSEAGCGMNCPFCATGQGGLQRNLTTAEIVWQVYEAERRLRSGQYPTSARHITNIVFMGMGEPMANYRDVMKAIRILNAPVPDGLGISARGITVSTVGMVPRIQQMARESLPLTLAVSLHAPDDELRDELVPLNKHFKVDQILDAAWDYARETKRRVSIEYIMIRKMNDQAWRADLLAKKLKSRGDWGWFHVNLIPLNPTPGSQWTRSDPQDEREFVARLEAAGVPVTIRESRGQDIDGACGQLASAVKDALSSKDHDSSDEC